MSEEYKEFEAAAGNAEAATEKKTSPWMWVAIGCGGLAVILLVVIVAVVGLGLFVAKDIVEEMEDNPARAIAEMAIRSDPNLEIIDSDDESFTIRDESTGEEVTIDFEDIAEGKLSFSTGEGEMTVETHGEDEDAGMTISGPEGEFRMGADASADDVPGWVPLYPDVEETSGAFQMEDESGLSGMVAQTTEDGVEDVLEWFKDWFEDEGYEVYGQNLTTSPAGTFGAVTGEMADEGRGISVTIAETEEGTSITVNYTEGG